jgi:hypothetical protein
VDPRAGLDAMTKRKFSSLVGNRTPIIQSSSLRLVSVLIELRPLHIVNNAVINLWCFMGLHCLIMFVNVLL